MLPPKDINPHKTEDIIQKNLAVLSNSCIVEIGVLFGDTTKIFLENSQARVFGIDPIIPDSMNRNLIGNENKIIELTKIFKNFTFIKDYSYNVVKTWTLAIDYIFIDGDHNYSAVKQDFEDWFPFVIKNGYIGIHDSRMYRGGLPWHHGPSIFADELLKDPRVTIFDEVQSLTIFKKQ